MMLSPRSLLLASADSNSFSIVRGCLLSGCLYGSLRFPWMEPEGWLTNSQ